jgi:DNA-binding NarL/FixJ family response regulator
VSGHRSETIALAQQGQLISVAVIDREGFYLDAIITVLESQPDVDVVAGVTIYEDFVNPAQGAEIVVLQYESDLAQTRRIVNMIREDVPDTPVIIIGVPDDNDIIVGLFETGALGYVRESNTIEDVLQSLRVIANGQAIIDPQLVRPILQRLTELSLIVRDLSPVERSSIQLTPRQEEVLELVAKEYSNEQIAEELGVSIGTVKNHMNKILRAFGVPSRHHAASIFLQMHDRSTADEQ